MRASRMDRHRQPARDGHPEPRDNEPLSWNGACVGGFSNGQESIQGCAGTASGSCDGAHRILGPWVDGARGENYNDGGTGCYGITVDAPRKTVSQDYRPGVRACSGGNDGKPASTDNRDMAGRNRSIHSRGLSL